jgi:hypothetical protein
VLSDISPYEDLGPPFSRGRQAGNPNKVDAITIWMSRRLVIQEKAKRSKWVSKEKKYQVQPKVNRYPTMV